MRICPTVRRWNPFLTGAFAFLLSGAALGAQNQQERKSYMGVFNIGPAIPFGGFADKSKTNPRAGRAKLGYHDSILNFGRQKGEHLGIAVSFFYNEHDIEDPAQDDWWQVAGITAGAMYSFPISRKAVFDLKGMLGFIATTEVVDSYKAGQGVGLATDLRALVRYNVSRRFALLAQGGVLLSNQSMTDGSRTDLRILISGLGVAYRPSW